MRDEYLLPENPVPPANCASSRTYRTRADGGAEEAMAAALRETRIRLWGDLWQKVERLEHENLVLRQRVQKLTGQRDRANARAKRGPRRPRVAH